MARPRNAEWSMDDYVDVAERISQFYERYPEGRLVTGQSPTVVEIDGKPFIWYHAQAYRTPDDPLPGSGWAAEPVPGPTQFTRDSELMNAETAAWGRAIVSLGFATKKIASRQEVQNRRQQEATADQRTQFDGLLDQLRAIDPGKDWLAERIAPWVQNAFGKRIGELNWAEYDTLIKKVDDLLGRARANADNQPVLGPTLPEDAAAAADELGMPDQPPPAAADELGMPDQPPPDPDPVDESSYA